jgi:hypothetical protein
MIIAGIAVLAIAAITVVSRQSANGPQKVTSAMAHTEDARFTKLRTAAQDAQVDGKSQIRPLTPEEAKKLADGLKGMLNKSTEGLVAEHEPDGSTSVDLQDRFQNVIVARENSDGTVSTACVDNPRAAGNFLGIDPKLIQRTQTTNQPPKN